VIGVVKYSSTFGEGKQLISAIDFVHDFILLI
jgi:hypothetical protein